ncbi:hypothetical protein KIN20_027846 [Parelaphostrongylus tenuis]|uniref:Uncharacterized protein n=1 Tax=Parelaphostrongylus tenuis TaxID=148309 RepID=A0AAD5R041_PARTN|nr:hypothetical protein KIN20_027846 [Parelaphostrongylus tenuis]
MSFDTYSPLYVSPRQLVISWGRYEYFAMVIRYQPAGLNEWVSRMFGPENSMDLTTINH